MTTTIALISDVFHDGDGPRRLTERLRFAAAEGATLALLPELPLNPWSPASTQARDEDAEAPGGPRHRIQSEAAAEAGIALVGGAIVIDPETGVRRNTALVYDAHGGLLATYAKLHIPEEPGFWEARHYAPGERGPSIVSAGGLRFGIQICSDVNRPVGSLVLGAMNADAVLAPRATEAATWDRWRLVLRANAITASTWVLSVNRPAPEFGVLIGGPSIAVAPDGSVTVETTDPIAFACVDRSANAAARDAYPGYLPVWSDLYANAWAAIADEGGTESSLQEASDDDPIRAG